MAQDSENKYSGSQVRRRILSINDQIDSIQDASLRNYTRSIESRFKRLTERQAKMISETYDQLDREEKVRARTSIREQQEHMKRSLDNWRQYSKSMSKDLTFAEKFATNLFYWNRRKDLRNLEREARYRFSDISDDAKDMADDITDSFSQVSDALRDWSTALNVNSLVDGMEEATQSTRDIHNQLKKVTNLTSEEWDDLKQSAREFSKETGYAISNLDYLQSVSDIMVTLKIDDTQLAKDMAQVSTKFSEFTGLSMEDQLRMLETSQLSGMGGVDYQRLISSQMMAIQAAEGLNTSGEDLMNTYNENIDMFRNLANGNRDLLNQYTNSAMALTTAGNAGYIDGLSEKLFEIMNMSMSDLADQMEGGQFYLKDVRSLMQSGQFDQAAKAFIDGYNQMRTQMIETAGMDGWKELASQMDLEGLNESQLIETENIQNFFDAYDRSMQLINDQTTAATKMIDSYNPQATITDKLANWWKSSWIGDQLDTILDDLDLSLADIFLGISAVTNVLGMFKGSSGLTSKLSGLIRAGGSGLLSSLGNNLFAIGGNLVSAGGGALGTGASATVGATTALGASSVLGGLLGGAGLLSGGFDIFKAIQGKNSDGTSMTGKQRQDRAFSGGTKIGMVGAGAGAGAAIGSVIPGLGTAVGALIGAGVGGVGALLGGTKLGNALSDAWDVTKDKAGDLWEFVRTKGSSVWENLKSKATNSLDNAIESANTKWNEFTSFLHESWDNFAEWGENSWSNVSEWANEKWKSIIDDATSLWDSFTENADNAWDKVKSGATKAFDAVKDTAGNIWEGLKSFFTGDKSSGKSSVDGSHKNGLETVPRDGYIAELHKNEAVLTAEQAKQWRAEQNATRSIGFFRDVYKSAQINKDALIQSYQAGLASATTGSSGSSGSSGATSNISVTGNNKADIWNYLKQQGLTDYASAGIMGCWEAESGNNPNRVEGDYLKSFPGVSTVTASKSALSDYTQNVLFPAYARSGVSINKSGYRGSDGYYYPGFGLAQWTGPRVSALMNYAGSAGGRWQELATQLGFFWKEFTDRNLLNKMNQATSVADATSKFFDGFEMYAGASKKMTSYVSKRTGYANSYYNQYKGNSYDSGTPWVPNDQVALIHKGEMIVPAESNPYSSSNSLKSSTKSTSEDGTINELIQVVKWGVSRIEKAITNSANSTNRQQNFNLANVARSSQTTASDELFSFAST